MVLFNAVYNLPCFYMILGSRIIKQNLHSANIAPLNAVKLPASSRVFGSDSKNVDSHRRGGSLSKQSPRLKLEFLSKDKLMSGVKPPRANSSLKMN